ncbi:MAG TPA: acyl-CoA dehydrogenase C-terminal domain-containing protein [Amaricoccus sp.]|uniref:acyl-CoA dehydrogenase C-terminal domain-containing protein n=2 Tax=Amaricoccus TaxID=56999 RepID=UPI002C03DD18|nr:acyl-CoA dehydrogenase C-terminal domain-containing protein [Amaricoccus sp.]HRO10523.1 acyl-CoA dehydrogenase C-terminal domain-containing protein [Amaricoccus sp.]
MAAYTPPLDDMAFVLHDVLAVHDSPLPGYADLDRAFTAAILDEAGRIARDVLAPLNATGDRQGCRLENGTVRTPEGFRRAFELLRAGGWTSIDCDPAYGGQGLPYVLHAAVGEMHSAANMAFAMYSGLTHGAYTAIHAHGSDAQKAAYLPKLVTCEWTGTMNLTEPHAGTDLGLLRTRAEPQSDGTHRITGQKIFISAGDHDLAENIVHLVLARTPQAPAGVKGISLFIVPKYLPNPDGTLGERNALSVGKLEEKMGIHGNATCVMNYDGATGWLLGPENAGLKAMFTMMNEARAQVGMQGLAQAAGAYQLAAAYARERLQGRAIPPADPASPADPIIAHPDIRRLLLDQKAFVEGARAFALWSATLIDAHMRAGDEAADGLVSLLTPVVKGFLTDKGFEATVQAQQVFGGHGYIEETGISQFVRDARIAMIYEGANGIQALDLVGRKLGQDGGKPIMAFFDLVKSFIRENESDDRLKAPFLDPLKAASKDLQSAAMFFMQNMKTPNAALAGSSDFLHLFGHTCLGFMWARMAKAALAADTDFSRAKLATGRYYMARQLPATALHLARIQSGADPVMSLPADAF